VNTTDRILAPLHGIDHAQSRGGVLRIFARNPQSIRTELAMSVYFDLVKGHEDLSGWYDRNEVSKLNGAQHFVCHTAVRQVLLMFLFI